MQVSPIGSNTAPAVTVTKWDGGTFDNNVELRTLQPGTGNMQNFGCRSTAGLYSVTVQLNPSLFGISAGNTIPISAEVTSPCSGAYVGWSEDGWLSQCKPECPVPQVHTGMRSVSRHAARKPAQPVRGPDCDVPRDPGKNSGTRY